MRKSVLENDALEAEFADNQFSMRQESGGQEWILSYADVVTLLLCFFIMFIHFKEEEITTTRENSIAKAEGQLVAPKEPEPAPVQVENPETKESESFPTMTAEMAKIMEEVDGKLEALQIGSHRKEKNGVVVYLNEGGLFDIGKFKANPRALEKLSPLVELLRPHTDKIQIEIQGYADATPVRASRNSAYKTNLELSVLRALAILRNLQEQGLPEQSMAVTGFGEHKQIGLTENEVLNEEILSRNRRVSLRITPKD